MYNKIVNPKTNRKVFINSKLGKNIILNYINFNKLGGVLTYVYHPKYNYINLRSIPSSESVKDPEPIYNGTEIDIINDNDNTLSKFEKIV